MKKRKDIVEQTAGNKKSPELVSSGKCESCDGWGYELTVYYGKILCRSCSSAKVDEKTRANLWCPR
jgi:hypothetical protein